MSGDAGGGRVGDGMSGDARGWDDGGGGGGGLTVAVGMEWAGTMMTDERTRSGSKSVIRFIKSQTKLLLRQSYFSGNVTSQTKLLLRQRSCKSIHLKKPRFRLSHVSLALEPMYPDYLSVRTDSTFPQSLIYRDSFFARLARLRAGCIATAFPQEWPLCSPSLSNQAK